MFNFFKRQPKAMITIQAQTGIHEQVNISVNTYRLNKTAIFHAINEAATALDMRRQAINDVAEQVGKVIDQGVQEKKNKLNQKRK